MKARIALAGLIFALALHHASSQSIEVDTGKQSGLRRFALVIGAENYSHLDRLSNPVNDADAIAHTFSDLNFDFIRFVSDPRDVEEVKYYAEEIRSLAMAEHRPVIIFFYFSGHGAQDGAFAYLFPSTFGFPPRSAGPPENWEAAKQEELDRSAVLVFDVMERLSTVPGGISVALIDTCRASSGSDGQRSPKGTPIKTTGVLAYMATKVGSVAQDSSKEDLLRGPFSLAIQQQFSSSRKSIGEIFTDVGVDILDDTEILERTPDLINPSVIGTSAFFLRYNEQKYLDQKNELESVLRYGFTMKCLRRYLLANSGGYFAEVAHNFTLGAVDFANDDCRKAAEDYESKKTR